MTTNIQLRYAASRHTTAEPPVLQYRVGHEVPTSTSIRTTVIWDDWCDVPTVVIDRLLTGKGGE